MGQYLIDIKPNNIKLSGCEKIETGSRIILSGKRKLNIKETMQSEGQFSPKKIPKLSFPNLNSRLGVNLERLSDAQKMGGKSDQKTAVFQGEN